MSNVIKAPVRFARAERVQPFSLVDVQAQADEIVRRAHAAAAGIVAAAREQADAERGVARQEGHDAGHAQGLAEGRETGRASALEEAKREFDERHTTLVNALNTALDQADRQKRELLADAYRDLVDLALAVARRVIKATGHLDRDAAVANAIEAIDLAGKRSDMRLEVHPLDLETLETFAESLAAADCQRAHVRIVAESTVSPGGCRLRSADGAVDATLETQIDEIARHLLRREEGAS